MYVKASTDPLLPSQDVATFVEGSAKPVILFTLGSNILANDLGWGRISEIMNAFRDLNEFNFVCKCDAKFIRQKPQNVLFVDWMQQNELLGKRAGENTFKLDAKIAIAERWESCNDLCSSRRGFKKMRSG